MHRDDRGLAHALARLAIEHHQRRGIHPQPDMDLVAFEESELYHQVWLFLGESRATQVHRMLYEEWNAILGQPGTVFGKPTGRPNAQTGGSEGAAGP